MYAVMSAGLYDVVSFLGLASDLTEIRNIVNTKLKSTKLDSMYPDSTFELIEVETNDGYAFTALEKNEPEEGEDPEPFLLMLAIENFRVQAFLVPEPGVLKEFGYDDFIDDRKFEELVNLRGQTEQ